MTDHATDPRGVRPRVCPPADADTAALPAYETQPGAAGRSETYAESAARYYGGSHVTIKTPALDAYWRDNPLGGR